MQSTASALVIGHDDDDASSGTARRTLASSFVQASMLARRPASGSVGCQSNPGIDAAKKLTCSPVPLATSSTSPCCGRHRCSSRMIGSRLRAADGAVRRGSLQMALLLGECSSL